MSPIQSLRTYGTIYISAKSIRDIIGFGEPTFDGRMFKGFHDKSDASNLNLNVLNAFIPDIYKDIYEHTIEAMIKHFLCQSIGADFLDRVANFIQDEMVRRIESGKA